MINRNNTQLGYYLAGLIEGDGCIYTPKGPLDTSKHVCNPRIQIAFHKNERPLFELLLSKYQAGGIFHVKESNVCVYNIAKTDVLIEIVNLINGKFRTPKIMSLHKAIERINLKHNLKIPLLPLDKSDINTNP